MPKKRTKKIEPKQFILPMFAFSLVAGLGLTLFKNRPSPIPIQIAEIGQVNNCAQVAFSDNFEGTTLNNNKWFAYEYYSDGAASIDNNSLKLTIPAGKTNWPKMFAITEDKVLLEGDFVQEITVNSLNSTPSDQLSSFVLGLVAVKPESPKHWYRAEIFSNGDIQTFGTTDGVASQGTAVNAFKNTPTKLKMVRKGSTLTTYYDVGNGYVLHHILSNIYTGKMFVQLIALSHPSTYPAVSVSVDNYKLSCLPPLPANLKPTTGNINPGNQKITWDKVDGATGYLLRVDEISEGSTLGACGDKKGQFDACETLTDNSFSFNFVSGKKYHIWVHSYIDNVNIFSNPTDTNIFVTPTPAPTNLRHTCNPDGKSVRLMWDGIADADYYKLRIDDKKGNVTPVDGLLGKTEYVASIKPGETYTWWAHATKSSKDSVETERKDFKCTANSTPIPTSTPKPTVKATVKPTLTPEPSPSATPKISPTSTPRMSPTNPSYSPPSSTTGPDTTTTKATSTNPIARFFSWLAGLFD